MRYLLLLVWTLFLSGGVVQGEPEEEPWTVEQRVAQYGSVVDARLQPDFARAGVSYPPKELTLVVLKAERRVELYARNGKSKPYRYIRFYPIQAASGEMGPKLREGDEQVPEGIYEVEALNPNSLFHLSLRVNYPNAFDRAQAQRDGRTILGGDIMIHGSNVSIGCVAMGDPVAEDLFILAARTGLPQIHLLFCPYDFRLGTRPDGGSDLPAWTASLYADLEKALRKLPVPMKASREER